MEVTISGKDKKLLMKIVALAKRLGLHIDKSFEKEKEQTQNKPNGEELDQLMQEAAARGDLFKSISDPVAWQKEQRKDKILDGREDQ